MVYEVGVAGLSKKFSVLGIIKGILLEGTENIIFLLMMRARQKALRRYKHEIQPDFLR